MRGLESIIEQHPLFSDLKKETVKWIAECACNRVIEAGTTLAKAGDPADQFYLIREGRVAVQTFVPGHGPVVLQTIGPHDIVGWSWLFPPYTWDFDVKAVKATRAILFNGRCLRQKCEEDHELGFILMKRFSQFMVRRLHATRMQLLDVYARVD